MKSFCCSSSGTIPAMSPAKRPQSRAVHLKGRSATEHPPGGEICLARNGRRTGEIFPTKGLNRTARDLSAQRHAGDGVSIPTNSPARTAMARSPIRFTECRRAWRPAIAPSSLLLTHPHDKCQSMTPMPCAPRSEQSDGDWGRIRAGLSRRYDETAPNARGCWSDSGSIPPRTGAHAQYAEEEQPISSLRRGPGALTASPSPSPSLAENRWGSRRESKPDAPHMRNPVRAHGSSEMNGVTFRVRLIYNPK